ncbi:MAG: polysaccharide biosynthesis protein [Nitrospinota bacterium]|nr:polysaccharide biosynthesis protein [Nitrospinota bacterium]
MKFANIFTLNRVIILLGDLILLFSSYTCAYLLRFEGMNPFAISIYRSTIIPIILIKILVFASVGLHTGPWRYTGIIDMAKIIRASLLSLLLIVGGFAFLYPGQSISRAVLLIDTFLAISFVGAFRILIRIFYSKQLLHSVFAGMFGNRLWKTKYSKNSKRVLIYGADVRGEMLVRSILSSQSGNPFHIVGLIDNDPNYNGIIIHDVHHLGNLDDLEALISRFHIDELMIASNPDKDSLTKAYMTCQRLGVQCRTIPNYLDVLHQNVGVSQLKDISIDDLLGREPVKIDYTMIEGMFIGKRVLVTGAAGSIGSQLCKQVIEFKPSELICVDIGETPLFYLQQELKELAPNIPATFYCSDVTDRTKVEKIFAKHKPHMVYHAAALKHVPLMEMNVDEVIHNNVAGIKNVGDMAHDNSAEAFVFISTDKAVNPANVMGWTKRLGEIYTTYLSEKSDTKFLSVRFGNVLGSNGSVIPIFKNQIKNGGPVKVTHRDITRYFMTIPEAVLLILQSTLIGEDGDTMILDMGKPVRIADLAEDVIKLAGFTPGKEISITYTGLRPGEKLHEELMTSSEKLENTTHPKISVLKSRHKRRFEISRLADQILAICMEKPDQAYNLMRDSLSESPSTSTGDSSTLHH